MAKPQNKHHGKPNGKGNAAYGKKSVGQAKKNPNILAKPISKPPGKPFLTKPNTTKSKGSVQAKDEDDDEEDDIDDLGEMRYFLIKMMTYNLCSQVFSYVLYTISSLFSCLIFSLSDEDGFDEDEEDVELGEDDDEEEDEEDDDVEDSKVSADKQSELCVCF